jgi:TP901 family phage tail tape measure protein
MNAMLNIQVRVAAQQAAAQLNSVAGGVGNIHKAASGGGLSSFMSKLDLGRIEKFGKNLQWTGRQLEFNFTLPLLLAGGAATKWALANEKAMTQVRKVYGDLGMSSGQVKKETDLLAHSFELLSNRFGVAQSKVIDIAAAWAAAGSSGVGLAKSVQNTLEVMNIGDMDAEKAVQSLITIQSLYKLNSDQLAQALGALNIIENETAIQFSGLIDVVSRAGGAARTAGIDINYLSSMAAALVPHAASASQAGNSLRTIISRITAPTQDSIDIFRKMGIEVESTAWAMKSGEQRIDATAKAFAGLSQSQKNVVASVIGSRWQVSRFAVLMEDIASGTGNFAKAQEASSDKVRNATVYQQELNAILNSTPKRLEIMTNTMKNALTSAILPMMPAILGLVNRITALAVGFSHLSPQTQQFIITILAMLALMGPVVRLSGAFILLFTRSAAAAKFAGNAFLWVAKDVIPFLITNLGSLVETWGIRLLYMRDYAGKAMTSIGKVFMNGWGVIAQATTRAFTFIVEVVAGGMTAAAEAVSAGFTVMSGWAVAGATAIAEAIGGALAGLAAAVGLPVWAVVAIIAAVIAAIVLLFNKGFRDNVWDAIKWVIKGIGLLPEAMVKILSLIPRAIAGIINQITDMLSYLNPFARHSPSLVDNVRGGVDVIIDEYGRLAGVSRMLDAASAAHSRFLNATAGGRASLDDADRQEARGAILKFSPSAGPALDAMTQEIDTLKAVLPGLQAQMDQESTAVDRLKASLDAANRAVDAEKTKFDALKDKAQVLEDAISGVKERLTDLGNTPITGMRAFEDAIFDNEMAQKRLRLEMMRLEDQAGGTLDTLRDKMAALNGEQEMLFGQREELRLAGAGSDVLKTFDDQIAAIKAQKVATTDALKPLDDMQKQMDALQRASEELNLQKSINFDAQLRQIDQMLHGVQEMSFSDIVAGIRQAQGELKGLESQQRDANAAVAAQEQVLKNVEGIRDNIALQLDTETTKLDVIKQSYSDIESKIRDMDQAMQDYAASAQAAINAAEAAKGSQSTAEKLFDAGAGGDYEIPGGDSIIGREGDAFDIDAFNKDLEKKLSKLGTNFGKMDPFKPIKDAWNGFWHWMTDITPFIHLWDGMWKMVGEHGGAAIGGWFQRNLSLEGIKNAFGELANVAGAAWSGIAAAATAAWDGVLFPLLSVIGGFLGTVFGPVWDVLAAVVSAAWGVISTAIGWAWDNVIHPVLEAMGNFITNYLKPIFELIGAVVEIVFVLIGRVIRGAWDQVISPVLHAVVDFLKGGFGDAWKWIGDHIGLVWQAIGFVIAVAWAAIKAVFEAIGWFLSNVLGPAFTWLKDHVIAPVWNGITTAVSWAWENGIKPVFNAIDTFIRGPVAAVFNWLKDKVFAPVFGFFESVVKSTFNNAMGVIEKGINFFVSAFNLLAKGVNRVAGFLNIDVHVSDMDPVTMPKLAKGGIIPEADGSPGIFNRARAIVGEGNPAFPEYVIPTDPRYRDRAKALWEQAGKRLNDHDEMGGWGPIGWAADQGKKAIGLVGGAAGAVARGAAKAMFAPVAAAADLLINQIPFKIARDTARSIKDEFYNWVTGADSGLPEHVAGNEAVPVGAYANNWQRITAWLGNKVPNRVTSTFRAGDPGFHGQGRAVDFAGPSPSRDSNALLAINQALLPIAGTLKELIYAGPHGQSFKNGSPFNYSSAVQEDHHDHVHAALATGGMVIGPTNALIGEKGPEAVLPLEEFYQHLDDGFKNIVVAIRTSDSGAAMRHAEMYTVLVPKIDILNQNVAAVPGGIASSLGPVLATSVAAPVSQAMQAVEQGQQAVVGALNSGFDQVVSAINQVEEAVGNIQMSQPQQSSGGGSSSGGGGSGGGSGAIGYFGSPATSVVHPGDIIWGNNGPLPVGTLYDVGGMLPPGIHNIMNKTGRNEFILTPSQFNGLLASTPPLSTPQGRGSKTLNFYGDLSFPNIKSGEDADALIRNLEALGD